MAPRVIFGQRNAGEFGVFVSKPGKSAFSTDADDLLIDTTRVQTVAYIKGAVTGLPFDHSDATWQYYILTVPHSLGYLPLFRTDYAGTLGGVLFPVMSTSAMTVSVQRRKNLGYADGPAYDIAGTLAYFIFRNKWLAS